MRCPLAILCSIGASAAHGAPNVDMWCNEHPYDPKHPVAWEQIQSNVRARVDANDFLGAYQVAIDRFESTLFISGPPPADQEEEREQLAAIRASVAAYVEDVRRNAVEAPTLFDESVDPASGILSFRTLPSATDGGRVLISCDVFAPSAPDSIDRTIGYFMRSMYATATEDDGPAMSAAAAVATDLYRDYEAMLFDGLAMWPWELKFNDRKIRDIGPTGSAPTTQTILLRPSMSLALLFDGQESSEADYALTFEPWGFVAYRSEDYKKWWGISVLAAVTDDNGTGYGAMFRWDNYTLGIARHDRDGADDENVLYIGVDLYKFILGEDGRTNQARPFLNGLRDKLKNNVTTSQ